jgi:hypothetical protein
VVVAAAVPPKRFSVGRAVVAGAELVGAALDAAFANKLKLGADVAGWEV